MVDQEPNRLVINPLKYLNNLPDFHGDTRDLQTFITLIDRVHPHLQTYDDLSQQLFSDIIKSKFKGKAKQAIEINCHAVSWTDIKSILQNNFGDRRSCDELFDELRSVIFKTNTVEFYNEIKNRLHRLNNKLVVILGETEAARQSTSNNMKTALNIFKSKIPEPMKTILFCRNPTDLEQAMDILFQAGYAYNENQHTSHYGNRPQNKQSTHNTQQTYKKQKQYKTLTNNKFLADHISICKISDHRTVQTSHISLTNRPNHKTLIHRHILILTLIDHTKPDKILENNGKVTNFLNNKIHYQSPWISTITKPIPITKFPKIFIVQPR